MKKTRISKMGELSWVLGIVFCALGVALSTKAHFGLSMISAPSYIIHLKLVDLLPWYSQGTSGYIWQAFLLLVMVIILRRFKLKYVLSFATAVIYGLVLDGWLLLLGGGGAYPELWMRVISFILGEFFTALAIAFFFRTYLPLEIYELVVTEIAERFSFSFNKVKMVNDIIMLAVCIVLALSLHGGFVGIGIGTVILTVVNAPLITMFGRLIDKIFIFDPRFPSVKRLLDQNNK